MKRFIIYYLSFLLLFGSVFSLIVVRYQKADHRVTQQHVTLIDIDESEIQ